MIRIHIKNLQKRLPVDRRLINRIVRAICSSEHAGRAYEITVCLVTDTAMRSLNSRFHHCDAPTDVLAFPLSDGPEGIMVDIFVSADTAVSQAKEYGTSARYEMYLYVIHGLLHIAGYDDLTAGCRNVMRRKEKEYMAQLGVR